MRSFAVYPTLLAISFAFFISSAIPARATDYIISATSECTLEEAIRAANRGGAVGDCSAGQGEDTITLSSDITLLAPLPGIRTNISITSDGAPRTISGNSNHIIFSITGGTLTLERVILDHARNDSSRGGAISMRSGRADLTSVTIENSFAEKGGGAIRIDRGALTCNGCSINRNSGAQGGAIWVGGRGTLSLNSTSLDGNVARYGGAIFNKGGTVTLTRTDIGDSNGRGNTAMQGGGIFSQDGNLTLNHDTDVTGNRADTYGGGILVVRGQLNILGGNANEIKDNIATYGGGLFLQDTSAQIAGATFSGNSASAYGADLMSVGSEVTIDPSVSINSEGQYYYD